MVAALSAADHDRAVLGRQFDRRSRGARSGAARGAGLLALGDRAGAAAAARLAAFAARLAGTAKPLADPAAARRAGHRRVRHHALYRPDDDDRAQFAAAALGAARAATAGRCAYVARPDGAGPKRPRGGFAGGG